MASGEKFLRFSVTLLVSMFILHSLAIYFGLYRQFFWLDDVLHFIGGFWLGTVALWYIYFSDRVAGTAIPFSFALVAVVSFAVLGGVLWEFFEFSFDTLIAKKFGLDMAQLGLQDTMSDLFFDLIGALTAGIIFIKKLTKNEKLS